MAARPGSSLAEQAREYGQAVRSKHHHDWLPPAASSSSSSSSRPDAVLVIGELFMFAFLIFSGVSLYFRPWPLKTWHHQRPYTTNCFCATEECTVIGGEHSLLDICRDLFLEQ